MVQYRDEVVGAGLTAVADPSRRSILDLLAGGPRSVSELSVPLAISLPGVLKHLAVLEDAQLIATHKAGRVRTCELRPSGLDPALAWMQERHDLWTARLDRLDDLLKGQHR
jgi:DNA-binding transcriptional ArsR family regulator